MGNLKSSHKLLSGKELRRRRPGSPPLSPCYVVSYGFLTEHVASHRDGLGDTKPASLKESRPVESRVVLRVVVGEVRGDIVAGIPPSLGDVPCNNGRLCFVNFSC
jgi:hypothetical protein